ncbi:MAG: RNA 2',3'-cyclic phosphodiesterase [Gammaproteobacteria bacterium]|nr:RNA 2',3'-cyclic phosphodiesterase [Gammaproteobacteria bacterium]
MSTLLKLTEQLALQLKAQQLQLAVAESCTGGSLAAALTAISGSSHWFDRGFITYSNHAKQEVLGVPKHMLELDGAVSEATVRALAEGAIYHSDAHMSVSISGIAGPNGGTATKPVGTVWIAWAGGNQPTEASCFTLTGSRIDIRETAVLKAIQGLIKRAAAYVAPAPETPHYFFALWPDDTTKQALARQAAIITKQTPCSPSLPDNLHLTLAYLGALSPDTCEKIKAFTCPIAPFELKLTDAMQWSQSQVAYFSPQPSEALEKLHTCLNQHILKHGLKPERRLFEPHITLARDYTHTLASCTLNPIHWFVHELYLVKSMPNHNANQAISNYQIIECMPLTLKTC